MNTINTEPSKASIPDHVTETRAEPERSVRTSTKELTENDRATFVEDLHSWTITPGKSRYGRRIKPRSGGGQWNNGVMDDPQNDKPNTPTKQNTSTKSIDNSTDESLNETNSVEEIQSPKVISSVECQWMVGQLAWARIGNYPFWPCIITVDPIVRKHYRLKVANRSVTMMVHVNYFGDKGRHSWLSTNYIMEFTSLADFLKLAYSLTEETKKRNAKYAAAFVVKPGLQKKWQNAVQQATEAQSMTTEERIAIFAIKIKVPRSRNTKSSTVNENSKNKRKRSRPSMEMEEDGPDVKRFKDKGQTSQDNVYNIEKPEISKLHKSELKKNLRIANGKIDLKLNSDSLPSSPSSYKSSSESKKTYKIQEDEESIFQYYYEDNKDLLKSEYPDKSESDIKTYLQKTWDGMDAEYRKKLGLRITKGSLHWKESSPENEISIEIDTNIKENKKTKNKIDRVENKIYKEENKVNREENKINREEHKVNREESKVNREENKVNREENKVNREENKVNKEENKINREENKEENKVYKEENKIYTEENKVSRVENYVSNTKRNKVHNLFKGMKQEKVCKICEKTGKLTKCKGPCSSYFHLSCVKPSEESSPEYSVDENTLDDRLLSDLSIIKKSINGESENNGKSDEQEDKTFKCIDCLSGLTPTCFLCNEGKTDRIRCIVAACRKHYHSKCLQSWPQSRWQGGRLTCPYHICHTCSSDNPQAQLLSAPNEKMARCVRCPSSYHASTLCLPAGSVILTASQIICPKHYKVSHPLNAGWCFVCTHGGKLICCDTCPTSFHLECLGKSEVPKGRYICDDCETGRFPLYGEVVWVKLGNYRWWPSLICYPHDIPENIEAMSHGPGKFCVMFLGFNNYYWAHRGQAFLYQDDDADIKPPVGKKTLMDDMYQRALEEATKIHQQLKARRSMTKLKGLKPPPYVKLKVNKPVGNVKPTEIQSIAACQCNATWYRPCAPETGCLNRVLMIECSPEICPAGAKCMNQSFVLRQYPDMEPFHTMGRGWGLKTLENIKAGQFVIEYVGEIIDDAEYKRRLNRKKELKNENFYFLTIDNNRTIDAESKGNLSRFMNHSCAPNCETQKWTVNRDTRIGLFALRDIEKGEELTFNYNLVSDGETRKACLCGASNCSGFIGLKAQKQQLPVAQSAVQKIKKIDKQNRRWRKRKCWQCGQKIAYNNKFVVCSQRTCNKMYHQTCVVIDKSTESKFCCPWHFCSDCGRRTSVHCSFCSTAFCQVHFDGNLFERENEKNGFVCKLHKIADSQKPKDKKEYSDNNNETDKEYSSTSSTSSIVMEKISTRESSPRVSIVEVHLSSEESEESQKEEEENNLETNFTACDKNSRTNETLHKTSQKKENQAKELSNLTSSQLEAIIGVSLQE